MTREESIRKLEYSKKAYQRLIDEKVDRGKLVGKDVKGEWKADTPLDEVYKSMIDALEIAIKTLEQEPCEDAISRQAAIFLADELKQDVPDDERLADMAMAHNEGILDYQTQLSLLPSINPQYTGDEIQKMQDLEQAEIQKAYELGKAVQSKTGHWIFDEILDKHYYCSECKSMGVDYWDYCPYCGAKMVEAQETETWNGIHAQITAPKGTFERIFNDANDKNDI